MEGYYAMLDVVNVLNYRFCPSAVRTKAIANVGSVVRANPSPISTMTSVTKAAMTAVSTAGTLV